MFHVYCIGVVIDVAERLKRGETAGYEVIGFCLYDCTTGKRKYVTRDGFKLYIETKRELDKSVSVDDWVYNCLYLLYGSCKYVVFGLKKGQIVVQYFCSELERASKKRRRFEISGTSLLVFDINKGYIPTGLDKVIIANDRYYKLGLDLKDFSVFSGITDLSETYSLYSSLSYCSKIPIFDDLGLEYKIDLDGNYYVTSGDLGFFFVYRDRKVVSFDESLRRLCLNIENRYLRKDSVNIIIHNKVEELSFSYFDNGFSNVTFLISKDCRCKHSICGLMYDRLVEPLLEWAKSKISKKSSFRKLAKAVLDMENLYRNKDYDAMLEYQLLEAPYCEALTAFCEKHRSVNDRLTRGSGLAARRLYIRYI